MKKALFTFIISIVLSSSVLAQNVARECVLFEVFTGVNCPWCPGAASGIGRLLEEGKSVAAVAYHTSAFSIPKFYTNETNARANYYYISGYPTVKVDGMLSPSMSGNGGNEQHAQQAYNQGLNAYNQRINVTSPYSIDMSLNYKEGSVCTVNIDVAKVGTCNATDARLFVVLTESHIQHGWQGMSEVNYVTRDMIPNQNGTQLTTDTGSFSFDFDMAGLPRENCELVAWVQNYAGNKEVYQAVKLSLANLTAQHDMGITLMEETPVGLCSDEMQPRLTIKNYGNENLTSVLFNITGDNDMDLGSYTWEGNLANGESEDFVMSEIINMNGSSSVTIEAVTINGSNADEYGFDNIYTFNSEAPIELAEGYMKIQIKTGNNPEEQSIEIVNMDTDETIHTFTFEDANKVYTEIVNLTEIGCYRFIIKNANGEGAGSGFWGIKNKSNATLITGSPTENAFRYVLPVEFTVQTVSVDEVAEVNATVYPNPATSFISVSADNISKVSVYNVSGQLVFSQEVNSDMLEINTESWSNGMYYVNIETMEGNVVSEKVVVNK
ncbi:MAG: T9SS type A sorting domain-containing protein [Bacteroidales bacterium]|nr:T9SS type A sorting domain-containing protein [Bacteroidales bacterium]MBQ8223023.1 T9SS type A sorting domain-containing protein [Bacteroidales bacterium]